MRRTASFSTSSAGETLIAFAASDGPAHRSQSLTIAGAGLAWTLVARANSQAGTSEIWRAYAPTRLTNVTITSTQAISGCDQSLTVVAFRHASGVGAARFTGGMAGPQGASLQTTASGSVVYAVGNDPDGAAARGVGATQTIVHQWVDSAASTTFWVQWLATAIVTPGTSVQLNVTAPARHHWNMAIVEIIQ